MIGDGIEIRVLRVGKDGVRLGVSAPASVSVHRREIYDQIRDENRMAARAVSSVEALAARLRKRIEQTAASAAVNREVTRTGSDG